MFGDRGLFAGGIAPVTKIDDTYDRIYAIGDVHGCRDELNVILNNLIKKENFTQNDQLIFIGDYIDRGPNSPGVVSDLIEFKKKFPRTEFLRGNHEDMLIGYLYGHTKRFGGLYGHMFRPNGGDETEQQYNPNKSYINLKKAIPKEHRKFFLNTKMIIDTPNAWFVHAGFTSYCDMDKQPWETVVWERWPFLNAWSSYDKTVVHGHTPVDVLNWYIRPEDTGGANQINIDTGCVYAGSERCPNGKLTCLNVGEMYVFSVDRWTDIVHYTDTETLLKVNDPELT